MDILREKIDEIIPKWLALTASQEELKILNDWANQSSENLELLENLQKIWNEDTPEPILVNVNAKANQIWESAMTDNPKKLIEWTKISKYAAVLLILVSACFWTFYGNNFENVDEEEVLTEVPSYILRENKAGRKIKLSLPDGSIAYLNSSSSIKYLDDFEGKERRVFIEGEAFFEVAKDHTKPFIVVSKSIETIALGTSFNVNAFDSSLTRISLIEGVVKINQTEKQGTSSILSPGTEVIVNHETKTVVEQSFELDDVIGWKTGKLVFNHATLDQVVERLERWYGVEIKVKGKKPSKWIVTTVYDNQSLKNVLTDLQYSKKFAYEITQSNVTITF